MPGALSGLRVLDLSRVLAGPWAAQVFGDLGAEVIKIERPGTGDETRTWGPPYLKDQDGRDTADAAYFLAANRNKQSVCVDFTRPEGQAIIRKLAAQSDIFIENFKVGGLRQYGLDYAAMRKVNPRLIYCSITGFGQTGPYAPRAGYDFLIQGMGGLMSLTGRKDGEPGEGPQKVGVALTDILTGLYSVISVLAALNHRHATGQGQHIDLALLDVQVASLANQNMNYLTTGIAPVRMGNAHPNIVPYQDFPTADGNMILAVGNEGQFSALCQVLGHPEWALDARFSTNAMRVKHREIAIGTAEFGHPDPPDRALDRRLRETRRALRPDQRSRCGVQRSAHSIPRARGDDAASGCRHRADGRKSDPHVGDAGGLSLARRRCSANTR